MPAPLIFNVLSATFQGVGANWKIQAVKFALAFAVGVALGLPALLYFRHSNKAERFVTDLFATMCIGGGYALVLEVLFGGSFEVYGIVAYLFGVSVLPCAFKLFKSLRSKKTENAKTARDKD